jgi:hypothetical protein
MSRLHPIFETILKTQNFGRGRALITKTVDFPSQEAKDAYKASYAWTALVHGYGAQILSETETSIVYSASNSAD